MSPTSAPTPDDRAWAALGDTLRPAANLARIDAAAGRLVSQVSLVATVVAAGGLVTSARLGGLSGPRALAVAGAVAVLVAVVLAVLAQLSVVQQVNPDDLRSVQRWYEPRARWRGRAVAIATWAYAVGIVLAATAGGWAVLSGPTGRPVVQVETSTTEQGVTTSVVVTGAGLRPFAAGTATITAGGARLATAAWTADGTGAIDQHLQVTAPEAGTVEVRLDGWVCAPDGQAVACRRG